jgi:hypothetical protein
MGNIRSKASKAARNPSTAPQHNTSLTVESVLSTPETNGMPEQLGNQDLDLLEESVPQEINRLPEQPRDQHLDLTEDTTSDGDKSSTPLAMEPVLSSPEAHRMPVQEGVIQELDVIEVSVLLETNEHSENQQFDVVEVTAPNNAKSGVPFAVTVNGKTFRVTCPQNIKAGQTFTIQVPAQSTYHPVEAMNVTKETKNQGFIFKYGY